MYAVVQVPQATRPRQAPVVDAGLYRLFQSGAELGRESYCRTATTLESTTELPVLSARLAYRTVFDSGGRIARFELRVYNLATDSLTTTYTAVATGDTLHITQSQPGTTPQDRQWGRAASPDAVVAPQSKAGLLTLVDLAGRHDRNCRAWGVGEDSLVGVMVSFQGDSARLAIGPLEMEAVLESCEGPL